MPENDSRFELERRAEAGCSLREPDYGQNELLLHYQASIKKLADSGDRRRFVNIAALSQQANKLMETFALRSREVDDLVSVDDENHIIHGREFVRGGFGDGAESMRQVVASLSEIIKPVSDKNEADAGAARARELESLLHSRALLKGQKLPTKQVNDRIEQLQKEIANAVVSAVVLRGHQAGENGSEGRGRSDPHDVG